MSSARLVIDMTPLAPGGQNGGARLVATSLVRHIGTLRQDWELVLLTSVESHAALSELESDNVRRVVARTDVPDADDASMRRVLMRNAIQVVPPRLRVRAKTAVWRLRHTAENTDLVDGLQADLLFSPFTVPYFARPGLPFVTILHDLQHRAYPRFFSSEQRLYREQHVQAICRRANRIVCVSEHVRQTLLADNPQVVERTTVIPHGLLHEFGPNRTTTGVLDGLHLLNVDYLLYPANFWPHKNHLRLFEVLDEFRRNTSSELKLVCTGAPNEHMHDLQARARQLLGPECIVFPGYLGDDEFADVLDGCKALIYPSLYEGFGMPVLEAMARGKPVLCSTSTSLPEVAGRAAEYFDPTDSADMLRALRTLEDRPRLNARVSYGRERAAAFGSAVDMARKYIDLFEDVLAER